MTFLKFAFEIKSRIATPNEPGLGLGETGDERRHIRLTTLYVYYPVRRVFVTAVKCV